MRHKRELIINVCSSESRVKQTVNCQLSIVNWKRSRQPTFQLSTINYQLSTINYQLSTIKRLWQLKWMLVKPSSNSERKQHTTLRWFGRWSRFAAFCGIRRAHKFRGLHRFGASARLLGASIAAQEINQNLLKIWGQSPEIREPFLAPKNPGHPCNLCEITITSRQPTFQLSTINCQLSPSSPPPGSNLWKNIINEKLMFQLMVINVE